MKCPSCKKLLPYDEAIKRNKWNDKACPFCGAYIVFTVGIIPKHAGKWRMVTDVEDAEIKRIRAA